MENGLEKILMQATDSRFTGTRDFRFLFRSRHVLDFTWFMLGEISVGAAVPVVFLCVL